MNQQPISSSEQLKILKKYSKSCLEIELHEDETRDKYVRQFTKWFLKNYYLRFSWNTKKPTMWVSVDCEYGILELSFEYHKKKREEDTGSPYFFLLFNEPKKYGFLLTGLGYYKVKIPVKIYKLEKGDKKTTKENKNKNKSSEKNVFENFLESLNGIVEDKTAAELHKEFEEHTE